MSPRSLRSTMAGSSRLRVVAALVAVLVVVAVVLLYPWPFSFQLQNPGSYTSSVCGDRNFDSGAPVTFQWSTTDGSSVLFTVHDANDNTVYSQTSPTGSGSFTANGNTYRFCIYDWAAASVSVSGTSPFV